MPPFVIKIIAGLVAVGVLVGGFMLWLSAHDATVIASEKASCEADKAGMVSKATYEALEAIAERNRKDAEAAAIAATEAQRRALAARQNQLAAEARIDALAAEAAKNGALSVVSQEDLQWSAAHH